MYLKLAWRNLWRNRRRTLITVSSIMFAVIFAVFLESIERGAHDMMIDNMTSFHTGYLQIQDYRYEDEPSLDNSFHYDRDLASRLMQTDPPIERLIPRIETFMLAAGEEQTRGTMVLGIDLEGETDLNNLKDRLTQGEFFEEGDGRVVLGEGLAGRLSLAPGDSLALLGQGRFGQTAAGMFEISGLMRHPVRDLNNQIAYLSLPDAQWLLSAEDHITALLVNPSRTRQVDEIAESLRDELAGSELRVQTWHEMIPDLLEALEFDRLQTRFMMLILYVVVGFGIFGTILTMTLERLKEFGILLSVGMQRVKLAMVVFIETFMISLLGVFSGSLIGFFITLYFFYNPLVIGDDMGDVFADFGFEPILPAAVAPDIFLWQSTIVFSISLMICLYPVMRIIRLNILREAR